jgi:hypothetical protein
VKLSTVLIVLVLAGGVAFIGGCSEPDLRRRNQIQQDEISRLQSELQAAQMQLDQLKRKLQAYEQTEGVEVDALRQKVAPEGLAKEELIRPCSRDLMGVALCRLAQYYPEGRRAEAT